MPNKHGDFIWYELTTSDAAAAKDFYSAILGWTWETSEGQPDMPYHLFSAGETQVGGAMQLTDEMEANGARPCWLAYIGVDEVGKSAEKIKAAGGAVHIPPTEIPGIGSFAMVNDPQGAYLYIMQDISGEESHSYAAPEQRDGHCVWNELLTTDPAAAVGFYGDQFGWNMANEMDMPPIGKYYLLTHDFGIAGIMQKPDEMPMPAWAFYFRVPDIDDACTTIEEKGGTILSGPTEIPDGDFSMNGLDPQGAPFALVGPRR